MFGDLVDLAEEYRSEGVEFLVFSTDDDGEEARVAEFLARRQAPFDAVRVREWSTGQFDAAMSPFGIQVGRTWTSPLVAVRDRSGRVVVQGQGMTNLQPLRDALESGEL